MKLKSQPKRRSAAETAPASPFNQQFSPCVNHEFDSGIHSLSLGRQAQYFND